MFILKLSSNLIAMSKKTCSRMNLIKQVIVKTIKIEQNKNYPILKIVSMHFIEEK